VIFIGFFEGDGGMIWFTVGIEWVRGACSSDAWGAALGEFLRMGLHGASCVFT
jgi:hypothetical protein